MFKILRNKIKRVKVPILVEKIEEIKADAEKYERLEFSAFQSFRSIYLWPTGETRNLDGSLVTKLWQDKIQMVFDVFIPPGATFGEHWHDCIEECIIITGELHDRIDASRNTSAGGVYHVGYMSPHVPYNPSDTVTTHLRAILTVDSTSPAST